MLCTKCGGKLKVKDSRSLKSDETIHSHGEGTLLHRIGKKIIWYTEDFVARRRKCNDCGHQFDSIELEMKDFFGCLEVANSESDDFVSKVKRGQLDD
ncbi:MAG: hypothetical protein ACR2M6_02535 [Vampirovibrionia bacterium]